MKYLELLSGQLNIPLALISNINYTKSGNIVETHKNVFACRGFGCQELAVSLSLTPNIVHLFAESNTRMADWSFQDLCEYFMDLAPGISEEPFNVYVDNIALCAELKFAITSMTKTAQSDLNGRIQQLDVSITLSGTACSKAAAREASVSYDSIDRLPPVTIHCNGKSFNCRETCYITEFTVTPTTLNLELKLGTSYNETSADAWIYTPAQSDDSYITVDGYGKFYIKNASFDGDFVAYECSIFSKAAEETITKTIMEGSLNDVLEALRIPCNTSLGSINISNYTLNGTSIEVLQTLTESLGIMVGFRNNTAYLFDSSTLSIATAEANATLNYYTDNDVVSEPTAKVTYRDAVHEYTHEAKTSGSHVIVNSPICTTSNRAQQILEKSNILASNIDLTIPLDTRIQHYSIMDLNYQNATRTVVITDYVINFLNNSIALRCSYYRRAS